MRLALKGVEPCIVAPSLVRCVSGVVKSGEGAPYRGEAPDIYPDGGDFKGYNLPVFLFTFWLIASKDSNSFRGCRPPIFGLPWVEHT